MGYRLEAVLGSDALLRSSAEPFAEARVVTLRHGVAMLPLTDELFDVLNEADGEKPQDDIFWKFPSSGEDLFRSWSQGGVVAYIEVELFGGAGSQAVAVWESGRVAMAPFMDENLAGPANAWPVNAALARLGVRSDGGSRDLFAAVGLDCHRGTDDWAAHHGEHRRR
ncbi:hypothetical protein AB0H88_44405 [Nonomuraea sp. NPDC050680]|uniref:hypothetical protein n=1 Tax=Nonomuraea sp. NPDC050680 TaxID=3154630 RepID=UPI0033C3262C